MYHSLRLYLHDADRAGWVVIDEATGRVRAFAVATTIELTPDDWRHTWMPPRSVLVAATACHAESDEAAAECYPLLLQQIRQLAQRRDITRVTVQARPGDSTAADTWLGLGLRPSAGMAVRHVDTWRPLGPAPSGVTVRRARPADVEALADLAMQEYLYHAHHTQAGTSPDQSWETSRRLAAESVAQPAQQGCQLVAE